MWIERERDRGETRKKNNGERKIGMKRDGGGKHEVKGDEIFQRK